MLEQEPDSRLKTKPTPLDQSVAAVLLGLIALIAVDIGYTYHKNDGDIKATIDELGDKVSYALLKTG